MGNAYKCVLKLYSNIITQWRRRQRELYKSKLYVQCLCYKVSTSMNGMDGKYCWVVLFLFWMKKQIKSVCNKLCSSIVKGTFSFYIPKCIIYSFIIMNKHTFYKFVALHCSHANYNYLNSYYVELLFMFFSVSLKHAKVDMI